MTSNKERSNIPYFPRILSDHFIRYKVYQILCFHTVLYYKSTSNNISYSYQQIFDRQL